VTLERVTDAMKARGDGPELSSSVGQRARTK
jgi:hypothetical protein